MNYPQITDTIRNLHSKFIQKYNKLIEKNIGERHIYKEVIYSKIMLLGKAFKAAGVIDKYEEITIAGSDGNVSFTTKNGDVFFFLNGCSDVIFTAGGSTIDAYQNLFMFPYTNEENRLILRDVASDEFDWTDASKKILEIIHKHAYRKTEVLNDYINKQLSREPNGC